MAQRRCSTDLFSPTRQNGWATEALFIRSDQYLIATRTQRSAANTDVGDWKGVAYNRAKKELKLMYATQSTQHLPMSEIEYLAFADRQEFKYEYSRGQVYAMTGGSLRHNTITASTIIHLGSQFADRDCTVTTSDTRVHIASKRAYRYPDVTVFCGEPAYLKGRNDTITNPVLLIEVLSPSTALQDYNEKLEEYTQIETLQAYVIIAQDTPKVEVFRRHESGKWLYEYVTGLEAAINVPMGDAELRLALSQIYRQVQWETTPEGDETPTDE
jgi:Uma2 family endonuclease